MNAFVGARGLAAAEQRVVPAGASTDSTWHEPRVFEFEEEAPVEVDAADDVVLPLLAGAWTPSPAGRQAHEAAMLLPPGLTTAEMAVALAAAGHGVVLRRGLGTPRTPEKAASNLRNEFVVVVRMGPGAERLAQEIIIEPRFRSHFELAAGASSRYSTLLASLPDVFAGPARELAALVRLVAAHLALEYRRLDRDTPPWRSTPALLSLWAPGNARDEIPGVPLQHSSLGSGTESLWGSSAGGSPVGSPVSVLFLGGGGEEERVSGGKAWAASPVPAGAVFGFDVAPAPAVFGFDVSPKRVLVGSGKEVEGKDVAPDARQRSGLSMVKKGSAVRVSDLLPKMYSVQVDQKWFVQ